MKRREFLLALGVTPFISKIEIVNAAISKPKDVVIVSKEMDDAIMENLAKDYEVHTSSFNSFVLVRLSNMNYKRAYACYVVPEELYGLDPCKHRIEFFRKCFTIYKPIPGAKEIRGLSKNFT